jgi:hypothetical protein
LFDKLQGPKRLIAFTADEAPTGTASPWPGRCWSSACSTGSTRPSPLLHQPRPAEDDHRHGCDQPHSATTSERPSAEGLGRLQKQAQKLKMLETQGPTTNPRRAARTPLGFCACFWSLPKPEPVKSAQTLKPRARSWSRPSSVIISMPHGGIQTQLITQRSTKPSSAVWV